MINHQMNPQERFNNRAEDYAKYRPSYPSEAIDCILEGLDKPDCLTAADIGAGTGIASHLLAEREVQVIAMLSEIYNQRANYNSPLKPSLFE